MVVLRRISLFALLGVSDSCQLWWTLLRRKEGTLPRLQLVCTRTSEVEETVLVKFQVFLYCSLRGCPNLLACPTARTDLGCLGSTSLANLDVRHDKEMV